MLTACSLVCTYVSTTCKRCTHLKDIIALTPCSHSVHLLHFLLIAVLRTFHTFFPPLLLLPSPLLPSPLLSYDLVFKSLPPIRRSQTHTEPYCTDIIELPFSVFALDHLSGVQDRHSYDTLEGTHREEEKELKEVRDIKEDGRHDREEVKDDT